MSLSKEQIGKLLSMISTAGSDELDCDGCLDQIAEFAELQLASKDIPAAMQAVQAHLEQCACCQDEFQALLEGLESIAEPGF